MVTVVRRPAATVGAFAVVAGVGGLMLGALMLLVSGGGVHYLVTAGVLVASGAALIWRGVAQSPPTRWGWLVAGALASAGLVLSLFVVREEVCCMFAYHRGLGYPWAWLDAGGTADTLAGVEELRANPGLLNWHLNWLKLIIDGLFWAYAALLLVALAPPALRFRRAAA